MKAALAFTVILLMAVPGRQEPRPAADEPSPLAQFSDSVFEALRQADDEGLRQRVHGSPHLA